MSIILFRYHKHDEIALNRLRLLKKCNPDIRIYGLFGGTLEDYNNKTIEFDKLLENDYFIKHKSKHWKWFNGDLVIREWFDEVGKNVDFGGLFLIEYDLLLLDSLQNIYGDIPKDKLSLTAFKKLSKANFWTWTDNPYDPNGRIFALFEYILLQRYIQKNFNKKLVRHACNLVGSYLPKSFLEKYSQIDVPRFCNDEVRILSFAQAFKYPIQANKLQDPEYYCNGTKEFNCIGREVSDEIIKKELANPTGRRAFHPKYGLYER